MHVPVTGSAAKQKEGRAATRRSTAPGTLVSGTVLHVHADQATVQLSDGAPSVLIATTLWEPMATVLHVHADQATEQLSNGAPSVLVATTL